MTPADALKIALTALREDEAEREAVLELLAPTLLGEPRLMQAAIAMAWDAHRDEICAALAEYQEESARIDAEAGGDS